MNRSTRVKHIGMSMLLIIALLLPATTALAHDNQAGWATYEITLENLTPAQIFSPPIFIAHDDSFRLFRVNGFASEELRAIAEDGNNGPAAALANASHDVFDVEALSAPLLPGASVTAEVIAPEGARLSLAAMLVQTNDGFAGASRLKLPRNGTRTFDLNTYDAGTEQNNELAAYVPGPPFGGTLRAPTRERIRQHPGILGVGDIDPAVYNWTDPSARLTITRVDNWIDYQVTLENLTPAQVFSPPIFVAHTKDQHIFEVGAFASDELRAIAEDGNNGPLASLLAGAPGIFSVEATSAPVPPGQSVTVVVRAPRGARLSLAAMLVQTNDGFTGIDGLRLGIRDRQRKLDTYDAGTEANNELAAFVPGPPFGGTLRAPTHDAIAHHPGILGVGDVDPNVYNWTDPSARLTVAPLYP